MLETFNHEIFAAQLNTKFALADAPEPFELELIEATAPTATATQTFFSLFFRGRGDKPLPQGTYRMTHERLGEMEIFLVPTALDGDGFKYEAVFNLLNEAQ